ncbi:MAG: spore germination protein GerW family protein [Chloroflexota bacterium]
MSEQQDQTNSENMEKVLATIAGFGTVDAAFGPARVMGDYTVIPVAEIAGGMGTGFGGGRDESGAGGSGGGAGGAITTRPIATIVVGPEGVSVKPVYDLTKLWLAAIMTLAFVLPWLGRLRSARAAVESETPARGLKFLRRQLR